MEANETTSARPTIGLAMIVKDEAAVIGRCIASVLPLVDTWTIVDTGSTDGTQELVRALLGDLPGTLHERPWRDFGANRSELMRLARGTADYLLLVDADMTVRAEGELPPLDADAYLLLHAGSLAYRIPRLVRGDLPWRYVGATHEYLACDEATSDQQVLDALVIEHHADGGSRADKFERDRRLLERAVAEDPGDERSAFYLAQTYADLGEVDLALAAYRRRVELGGWEEETFVAQLRIGELLAARDWPAAVPELLAAWELRPRRAEPLYRLAQGYRARDQHWLAAVFARTGSAIPFPADDLLFVEREPYDWGLRFERSISAYWSGHPDESLTCSEELLDGRAPDWLLPWVHHNRQSAQSALGLTDPLEDGVRSAPGFGWVAPLEPTARLLGELVEGTRFELLAASEDDPDAGWSTFNPSVSSGDGRHLLVLRHANYKRLDNGQYESLDGDARIRTRNRIRTLDTTWQVLEERSLVEQPAGTPTVESHVLGVEDVRPIRVGSRWVALGTCRDRNLEARCQIGLWDLGPDASGAGPLRILEPPEALLHEKNWMPFVVDGMLHVVYACNPLVVLQVDLDTASVTEVARAASPEPARYLRGGSQGVEVAPDRWVFLAHEACDSPDSGRTYVHRFLSVTATRDQQDGPASGFELSGVSSRFTFTGAKIEFCAGATIDGDDLVCAFGRNDAQALLVRMPLAEALGLIDDVSSDPPPT